MAEAIYDCFLANYETDTGNQLSGSPQTQVAICRNFACIATRTAQGIVGYMQEHMCTTDDGYTVELLNKTGAPSVKGTVLQASTTTDSAFALQSTQADAIGICYDNGIPDGSSCRVVVAGVADVLLADGAGVNRYDWLGASPTVGRAYSTGPVPPPVHYYEIGHSLQTVAGGVDVLCRAAIHFL